MIKFDENFKNHWVKIQDTNLDSYESLRLVFKDKYNSNSHHCLVLVDQLLKLNDYRIKSNLRSLGTESLYRDYFIKFKQDEINLSKDTSVWYLERNFLWHLWGIPKVVDYDQDDDDCI